MGILIDRWFFCITNSPLTNKNAISEPTPERKSPNAVKKVIRKSDDVSIQLFNYLIQYLIRSLTKISLKNKHQSIHVEGKDP